ncbi:hypothetical protein COB57_03870 [Candidatus Peregrinibacteria bacterium]|nr:MAG: hypothetical protein COB57_03870 [Candidatus Peregrinibacteria bacterium]
MRIFQFLAGILGGTALGLLFAKREGKSLRKELSGKSSKDIAEALGKEMLELGKDAQETVQEIMESPKVKKAIKKGKTAATKVAKKVIKNVKKEAKKVYKEAAPKVKKAAKKVMDEVKKQTSK